MTLVRWKPMRSMTAWNPVTDLASEIVSMQQEIDNMFDRFRGGISDSGSLTRWTPATDIVEQDNEYIVRMEVPGVDKNNVKITVMNNVLSVEGERKVEEEKNDKNFHRVERAYGSFYRSFTLPSTVLNNKIEASYLDGVLSITIPKAEEAKPKEIEVKIK